MQNEPSWDDLRVLLALSRARSLSGAALRLGVNPSTIGRRLDALEAALGVHLFDRTPDGVLATAAAEQLVPFAEAAERAADDVVRTAQGLESVPEGTVRITAPPGVAAHFVAPRLVALRARHPRLTIELDSSVGYVDLTRREADIALRANRPETGDLIAVSLGVFPSALLAGKAYAKRAGVVKDLAKLDWITWGPGLSHLPDTRWILAQVPPSSIALRTDSIEAQITAAAAGLGVTVTSAVFSEMTSLTPLQLAPALAKKLPPLPDGTLWLVGHRALRDVPRISVVWDAIVAGAKALRGE